MVTVKDFYEQNEDIRNEVIIAIQENLPQFPDTLWEGYLSEVPEKFYDCEVVQTGKSLKAAEEGITKYYLYISEAPKKPRCFYTLCIWEPEAENEIPVMFNIGAWLTMQETMLEEFEGYSPEYKVELEPNDWLEIYKPEDEPNGFHLNLREPFLWEYVNHGVIWLNSHTELVFVKDEESKKIKFLHAKSIDKVIPFSDEEGVE